MRKSNSLIKTTTEKARRSSALVVKPVDSGEEKTVTLSVGTTGGETTMKKMRHAFVGFLWLKNIHLRLLDKPIATLCLLHYEGQISYPLKRIYGADKHSDF